MNLFYAFTLVLAAARFVVVDTKNGVDVSSSLGSVASPYKTIGFALQQVSGLSDVTITVKEGRYEESNLVVKNANNLVIRAQEGEKVIIDATKVLSSWTKRADGVFTSQLDEPVWQLFIQDGDETDLVQQKFEMVGLARFPNAAAWSDKSWNRYESMRHQKISGSSNGKFIEESDDCEGPQQKLSGQPSLDGCVAILNTGHWVTYAEKISHNQGNDFFTYPSTKTWYPKHSHYFVEGCLAALDVPGEWALDYSGADLTAYVYPPSDEDLTSTVVRGTTASTILTVHNSRGVELRGLTFFAGGVRFVESFKSEVVGCEFDHASYSRRALGSTDRALGALTFSQKDKRDENSKNNVRQCKFSNTDGAALELFKQTGSIIEDNFFKNIDYSALHAQGAVSFQTSQKTKFQYNHVDTTGSSETILAGKLSLLQYNYFTNGGLMQEDGAAIQIRSANQDGARIIRNWAIGNGKLGFRFDSPTDSAIQGSGGIMKENVAFMNRRGLAVKGNDHKVIRNTALMNEWGNSPDIIVYKQNLNAAQYEYNDRTITKRNFAGSLSGMTSDFTTPLRAGAPRTSLNFVGRAESEQIFNLLRDPAHGDFRPVAQTYNKYGAYRTNGVYWIPGPRLQKPSFPLPASLSTRVPSDVDLKWKPSSVSGTKYDIYFGSSLDDLDVAEEEEYSGNVWTPPTLTAGESYYWLVVASSTPRADIDMEKEAWTFTVADNDFVYGGSDVACADDTKVDMLNELKTTILQNDAWKVENGEGRWCSNAGVEAFYNTKDELKSYEAPTSGVNFRMYGDRCLTWQCAFDAMYVEQCDLQKIAREDIGHKKLGRIARELSQPFCLGECPVVPSAPALTVPQTSQPAFPYANHGCNEEQLLSELQEVNTRREQVKSFTCNKFQALYDASAMLKSNSCTDEMKKDMGKHVYNFFKFDDLLEELINGCARRHLASRLLDLAE